tara:strand:+ start:57 stop:686 length:630 start_codon:yes stop_codon:yes gene_type:complete
MEIDVTFKPDAGRIRLGVLRWANSMDDWTEAWQDVIKMFRHHESRHFRTEGKSTGKEWVDLSPNYSAWKEKRFPGRPKLVLRGTLRAALVKGGPGSIEKVTKTSMVVGIAEGKLGIIARAHSLGVKGRLPARPPVRFDPRVSTVRPAGKEGGSMTFGTAVAQIMQAHIIRHRKRAFYGLPDPFQPGARGRYGAAARTIRKATSGGWKTR